MYERPADADLLAKVQRILNDRTISDRQKLTQIRYVVTVEG